MRNRGVTLLEVLLTLCVLVAIAALVWPAIQRGLESQRLRAAAEQVRSRWVGARVKAIESGRMWSFRYVPGGASLQIAPEDEAADADPLSAGTQSTADKLPQGIVFVTVAGSAVLPAVVATDAAAPTDSAAGWSDPISFLPDGTTTTATVRLQNQQGRCIDISLRGLTGVVSIGDLKSIEEAGQ